MLSATHRNNVGTIIISIIIIFSITITVFIRLTDLGAY